MSSDASTRVSDGSDAPNEVDVGVAAGAGTGAGAGSGGSTVAPVPAVACDHLHISVNKHEILTDVTFQLHEGDRCLVLGANGAGYVAMRSLAVSIG